MAGLYAVYVSAKNMTALALHKAVALAWATSRIEAHKNGMSSASYTDPSNNNILANDKGGLAPATVDTNLGNAMLKHFAVVTWTE